MKKTKLKSAEKYLVKSFEEINELYENRDENSFIEVLFPTSDGIVHIYPLNVFNLIKDKILTNEKELKTKPETDIIPTEKIQSQNMVSEDYSLKMLAIALNNEKYKDLK